MPNAMSPCIPRHVTASLVVISKFWDEPFMLRLHSLSESSIAIPAHAGQPFVHDTQIHLAIDLGLWAFIRLATSLTEGPAVRGGQWK